MARRVDQLLAGFVPGDAISNEARVLTDVLRGLGYESEIFVDPAHMSRDMFLAGECRDMADYTKLAGNGGADNVLIHHYSIGSPVVGLFAAAKAKRVLLYHNITPAEFYVPYEDRVAEKLRSARDELARLLPRVDAIWADSRFNAEEMEGMVAANVKVLPLLFSEKQFENPADASVMEKFAVPMRNLLYVGRIAPNKGIEELILAFTWYHKMIDRQSRLILVGSEHSAWRYYIMLRLLASEMGLSNVYFEGFVPDEKLTTYYRISQVFVTASRHEGYCLPLVEAMYNRIPVVARRLGGMPEALGGAGVLYEDATPAELAALIHRVLSDPPLRAEVLASQDRRVAEMRRRDPRQELAGLLAEIAPGKVRSEKT